MRLKKNQKGQSVVEFLFTSLFFIGFFWFFVRLSLVFAFGNYLHYATFMSARALLSASKPASGNAHLAQNAIDTIKQMLSMGSSSHSAFEFIAIADPSFTDSSGIDGLKVDNPSQYKPDLTSFSWLQGIRYQIKAVLPLMFFFSNKKNPLNLVLTSESWLGKEPSVSDCQTFMKKQRAEEDNGC
jgi:hypothetical protein